MTDQTSTRYLAGFDWAQNWHNFWAGEFGGWIITRGLRIVMMVLAAVLLARLVNWTAQRVTRRIDADFQDSDALVRSETAKHRQAVASVISWVTIALICVMVLVQITDVLAIPVSSLVAPAAVLGAALGFGAQRIVQDLLSGFFIITEKQYGFGDLVQLTLGSSNDALGTVVDVTLRVTKLRTSDGEMYTIPNGQIMKTLNLSKDWARAVIDIPVPTTADLNKVNDLLHDVTEAAAEDPDLKDLLLDKPQLLGVDRIEVDIVHLQMVARTLPGKQFEVGRRLRLLVVATLARAGIASPVENTSHVEAMVHPATAAGAERRSQGPAGDQ